MDRPSDDAEINQIIPSLAKKSRHNDDSDDSDDFSDEELSSQDVSKDDQSSPKGSDDDEVNILESPSKLKTNREPVSIQDTQDPLLVSSSKQDLSESDQSSIIPSNLKPDAPKEEIDTHDALVQLPMSPSDITSSALKPEVNQECDENDVVPLPDCTTNSPQETTSTWSSNPQPMKVINFTKKQGLLVPPPSDPYEAFRLLIDDDLLDIIVRETNANALRTSAEDNVKTNSRIKNWTELTRDELLIFLGLLLHTGTIGLNRISDYWKRHYLINIPCFAQFMSRNRFLLILRCLNFTSESCEDRVNRIRPVMDHFNKKMNDIYSPGKELSVDECMVLLRGRLLLREIIKNKTHKYGIKVYSLAEQDGTIVKFHVQTGGNIETADQNDASNIVLKLLEERMDCGHHLYLDNYYNSYALALTLLERDTYCTGPLKKNRKDNPIEIENILLEKGENKSLFLNGVHIGKWRNKRYEVYISTKYGDEMIPTISKMRSILKPKAIVYYKNFISGVEIPDQMLAYYPFQRKTLRWHKKLFVHILQISLSNAFSLYNKYSKKDRINMYNFRLQILEKLLPDPSEIHRRSVLKIKHELTKIEKVRTRQKKVGGVIKEYTEVARKQCKGCGAQKIRMQTIYECKQCEGSPGFCTKCFCLAHS
ncbi:PREDICTED: piggyBac transposable element-derived protein 4-like [Papilio polytes]|uniref:piggyBac transposable element-derived protein 4-like n=1 Tax=Papilio polytes TaxID=76194 RepID=UPI000675FA0A|nr:PREDICTED: piggyBac transposable element-derived protein 4-like [Papilio polytes]